MDLHNLKEDILHEDLFFSIKNKAITPLQQSKLNSTTFFSFLIFLLSNLHNLNHQSERKEKIVYKIIFSVKSKLHFNIDTAPLATPPHGLFREITRLWLAYCLAQIQTLSRIFTN